MRDKTTKLRTEVARKPEAAGQPEASRRVRKVKGGWRLPGDPQLYPYNPLVPPDAVMPVPRRPGKRSASM